MFLIDLSSRNILVQYDFVDKRTDSYYVALSALNIWYLDINKSLSGHIINMNNIEYDQQIYEKSHFYTKKKLIATFEDLIPWFSWGPSIA